MQERQNYERAVTGALLGLGLQLLVGLTLLGLAIWLRHPAVTAAAWHAGGGLALWIILLVTFQQHQLERTEALEAEKLSQLSGADGRLFEQAEEDLSVARRRLRVLDRYGLPFAALLTALYLLGVGIWLLIEGFAWFNPETPPPSIAEPAVAGVLSIGAAFLGFVTSRYLSGLARQGVWQLLRGGAGYLMGSVLMSVLLAVSFALDHFETQTGLMILIPLIPACMTLLGVEIALNLILDVYRPRRKGEFARPAFDSRLLGLLTSPESLAITVREAINYQFGFEITRSWFWRLLGRAILPLVGMGLLTMVLLSCLVIVQPHQQALVLRMGAIARAEPLTSGLHFKLPWPLEATQLYEVTVVHELLLGVAEKKPGVQDEHDHADTGKDSHADHEATETESVLWGIEHAHGPEPMWLVGVRTTGAEDSTGMAASVLNAYVPVQWRIKDGALVQFATASDQPEERLKLLATTVLSRYLCACAVDEILGPHRSEAGREVQALLQKAVDDAKLGIEIVFVGIAGLHPPAEGEVAASFHDTIKADLERQIAIEEAEQTRVSMLTETAGSVSQANELLAAIQTLNAANITDEQHKQAEDLIFSLLQNAGGAVAGKMADARSFRWTLENSERAKATRFAQEVLPYHQAPQVYRMRRYLEVLTEGLANPRKYLILGDREKLTVRLDLKDTDVGLLDADLSDEPKGK